jgi:hypothetical protein
MKPEYVTPIDPDVMRRAGELFGLPEVFPVADAIERDGRHSIDYPKYRYTWTRIEPGR